ncbi:phage holin family protein [Kocuria sp. JC486]|uniref:phage holin family protein n=1 Tax=Kocuria sp. JC486 TaxID=1970736 RepID=UPI0014246C64|nr:phage holin family protein [Kocuria sp. JC486]NHU84839.1 phage holin family protein [Kocuria sp. JC486]
MSHPLPPSETQVRAERESLGDMFKSLSTNLTTLIHQEIALAKAEVTQTANKTKDSAKVMGKGAGMLGGAGVAGHFVLLFLSLAIMWALGNVMNLAFAALIVAALWGVIAGILAMLGKKNLDRGQKTLQQATSDPMAQTRQTVTEIPDTVNPSKETP